MHMIMEKEDFNDYTEIGSCYHLYNEICVLIGNKYDRSVLSIIDTD